MNIKKIFLLITLVLLLIGVSYASEVSNDTTTITDTDTSIAQDTISNADTVDTIVKEETNENKEIKKDANDSKTVKSNSNSYDVTSFSSLHEALTADTYDTVTVNINSDITLTDNTVLNEAINNLIINGNGKTVDGDNQYQFLKITSSNTVKINNLKITNCIAEYGGAIDNYGSLELSDCSIYLNTAEYNGGAIYSRYDTTLTISNCAFNDNSAQHHYGGAIYSYADMNIVDSSFSSNLATDDAGAIYNAGKLTLTDSTFESNSAVESGGTIYNEGNMLVTDCDFNQNVARYGGSIDNGREAVIQNTLFENNEAIGDYSNGGALINSGTILITGCTFKNNKAECNGGAVENTGKMNVTSCSFYNNEAVSDSGMGGAIANKYWGTLTVNGNIFERNTAMSGGAIYNDHSMLTAYDNNFTKNLAEADGGAVKNYVGDNIKIFNNVFVNNSAASGAAIVSEGVVQNESIPVLYNETFVPGYYLMNGDEYILNRNGEPIYVPEHYEYNVTYVIEEVAHGENTTIDGNIFITNKANATGKAIVDDGINTIVEDNKNDAFSLDASTIHIILMANCTITNNVFDDGRINTEITIDTINNITLGTNITITGKFTKSDGTPISSANLKVSLNGVKYTAKTDKTGTYTVSQVADTVGINNVTVSYAGNTKYKPYETCTTFNVNTDSDKLNPTITINNIESVSLGTDIKISGTLKNPNGNALKNVNIKININGITTSVKTDKKGTYSLAVVADTAGTNNVTVSYAGNSKYNPASATTTYTVTQDTSKLNPILTVDSIENVKLGDIITIRGTFKNPSGKALTSANLKISINGIKTAVKTDKNGTYSLTITANTTGDNNIVVIYTGNSKYNPTRASTSFTIKQDTQITINPISNAKINEKVTITGTLKNDQDKALSSANIKVTLNGITSTVKTDKNGAYTLTTTNTIQGTNNITVTYQGNTKYNKSTKQSTFICT